MSAVQHIPQLKTITDFYRQLRIGQPQSNDFAIMRIEDQPPTKRLEMPLFRCNFYRLVFFSNTGVTFNLPNQHFDIRSNSIYFSYPGKLESWLTTEKISGYLVCFTAAFAHADALTATFHQDFPFFDFDSTSLICFAPTAAQPLQHTLHNMLLEMEQVRTDRNEMLRYLLYQYLVQVRRLYLQQTSNTPTLSQNNSKIYNDFRRAVDDYFVELADERTDEQISVSLIAHRLFLNPSYLNTVIKQVTGNTASDFLQRKTILEAKSYLLHTDLQIAEISFRLGFTNVTYFNRFFKRRTQQTPSQFRRSNS